MNFMPTKGIEYLLAIAYLLLLIPLWRLATRWWYARGGEMTTAPVAATAGGGPEWFTLPEGFFFHRGHTWARSDAGDTIRVGMDDFAYHLLGSPSAMLLPPEGTRLEQGKPGWHLRIDGHVFDILSPVGGEVVEVNENAVKTPQQASADPYDRGWLLKIRTGLKDAPFTNLLPHSLARRWMEETTSRISAHMGRELGVVMQDGGLPVYGFGRHLGGDRWHELAAELLLTGWRESGTEPADGGSSTRR